MLQRAADAGVTRIITIGTSLESSRRAIELAEKHANVYAVIGVHPTSEEGEMEAAIHDGAYKARRRARINAASKHAPMQTIAQVAGSGTGAALIAIELFTEEAVQEVPALLVSR